MICYNSTICCIGAAAVTLPFSKRRISVERTKTAIIEAFQQVLEETPINKITVKTIVTRCNITRNTFYYYFESIPELVEYHLTAMADQLLNSFDAPNPREELGRVINYFSQRKKSVLHIYRYLPREQFLPILDKIAAYVIERSIRQATAEAPISEEDLTVLNRFYKGALVGVFLDWLEAGMNYDMNTMAERLCELMEGSTRKAIEKSRIRQ